MKGNISYWDRKAWYTSWWGTLNPQLDYGPNNCGHRKFKNPVHRIHYSRSRYVGFNLAGQPHEHDYLPGSFGKVCKHCGQYVANGDDASVESLIVSHSDIKAEMLDKAVDILKKNPTKPLLLGDLFALTGLDTFLSNIFAKVLLRAYREGVLVRYTPHYGEIYYGLSAGEGETPTFDFDPEFTIPEYTHVIINQYGQYLRATKSTIPKFLAGHHNRMFLEEDQVEKALNMVLNYYATELDLEPNAAAIAAGLKPVIKPVAERFFVVLIKPLENRKFKSERQVTAAEWLAGKRIPKFE